MGLCLCLTLHSLREERKLRVFEDMVLRRIFGPRRDEVTGEWRRLHNEELNDPYSSPNMFRAPYAHRREVKIVLYSLRYHFTYRWPSRAQVQRGLVGMHEINLLLNKFRSSSWIITKIKKNAFSHLFYPNPIPPAHRTTCLN